MDTEQSEMSGRFIRVIDRLRSMVAMTGRQPESVAQEVQLDRAGLPMADPGIEQVVKASVQWLCRGQDMSLSADGGVARHYSLRTGWASSYPETTGYIIPTLLNFAMSTGHDEIRARARRMLDWLVKIQFPSGAFQGGLIDAHHVTPVHFNTGQILLGLAAGEKAFGGYREPMCRTANWLIQTQDSDGCWRSHPSPFRVAGEKTYYTHVAWGLLEAARVEPNRGYAESALANVRWALSHQHENGWFEKCCLSDQSRPLTHTIGYTLRGLLEAYRFSGEVAFLQAAQRTADGLLGATRQDGSLPGLLSADWRSDVEWVCLTGVSQIAHSWLMLFEMTGEPRYRNAAFAANMYVRRTVRIFGRKDTRGGVKGSFPIDGAYGRYEYLSWAAKFLIDSLLLEQKVRDGAAMEVTP